MVAHTTSSGDAATLEESETLASLTAVSESSATAAFEAIYQTCHPAVYRYALLSMRRSADAEDLVADTFTRALAAWRAGHGPTGRPLPWLLVICRHLATDRWRRQRLIGWLPLFAGGSADGDAGAEREPGEDDQALEVREFWIWFDAVTRAIPARQRELLFLRYERDLTDEDIGEILGLTTSGVRSLSARSIESLRRHPELLT